MSLGDFGLYGSDGLVHGCYVYMLLCQDDGPIYVKVGITGRLAARLQQLRTGCPVTPKQFYSFKQPNRQRAKKIERAIHAALAPWAKTGEWFSVTPELKAEFNAALREAIRPFPASGYPCKWDRVAVQPLVAYGAQRKGLYQFNWQRKGAAYHDFRADSKKDVA